MNTVAQRFNSGLALKVLASPPAFSVARNVPLCCCGLRAPLLFDDRAFSNCSLELMQFLANVLRRCLGTCCSDRSLLLEGNGLHGDAVPTSPLMAPMTLVDHCCVVDRFCVTIGLVRFQEGDLPLCVSAVILKLWLVHSDGQTHEFVLRTVNATMTLHGGQWSCAAHFLLSAISHRSA